MLYVLCLTITVLSYPPNTQGKDDPPSSVTDDLVSGIGQLWGQAQKVADQVIIETYATTATGAESVDKLMSYGGVAGRVLASIPLSGATPKDQVDAVVSAMTMELTHLIPSKITIEDIELEEGSAYICGTRGLMYDMKTMENVGTRMEDGAEGSTDLYIKYSFNNLHFFFDNFVQHVPHVKRLQGQLDLKLVDNEVELLVNIPSISVLAANVISGECIVHVKNFQADKLGSATAKLISTSKVRRYIAENKLNEALKNDPAHLEHLKNRIEVKVLVEFHKALSSTGDWVCKDKNLINLIKDKGGSLNAPVYTENFYTYCSNKKQKQQ